MFKVLKVVSFNIRYDNQADDQCGRGWLSRRDGMIDLLRQEDAHLIGTQEGHRHQLTYLAHALDLEVFGSSRSGEDNDEHTAILYQKGHFLFRDGGNFWISSTPDKIGSKFSKNSNFPRMVTWCVLEWVQTGQSILFINTHFDYNCPQSRWLGAKLICDKVQKHPTLPVVVTGDFNCFRGGKVHAQLTSLLRDTYRDGVAPGVGLQLGCFRRLVMTTIGRWWFKMGEFDGSNRNCHIDWILYNGKLICGHISVNTSVNK